MALVLLPATNRTFNTHYFKYWAAPTINLSMYTLGTVTYPVQNTNITMGTSFLTTGTYLFSLRVTNTNFSKGSCSITSPWTETTNSGVIVIGYNRQISTAYQSYIQVTVTPIYPYTFKGWYSAYSGGTLLTTTATVNVAYNNGYDDWYAQWN